MTPGPQAAGAEAVSPAIDDPNLILPFAVPSAVPPPAETQESSDECDSQKAQAKEILAEEVELATRDQLRKMGINLASPVQDDK